MAAVSSLERRVVAPPHEVVVERPIVPSRRVVREVIEERPVVYRLPPWSAMSWWSKIASTVRTGFGPHPVGYGYGTTYVPYN